MNQTSFSDTLITWYNEHKRELPWREEVGAYEIWISEIMLQQTRVDQATGYYHRFLLQFPTVETLANSPEQMVLKLWEGLGYYSRARNLHYASHQIMNEFRGIFPTLYEDLLKLKGIGEYTAGAIASFAYNLPYPAVDGNVFRFISRLWAIATPVDTSEGKKEITQIVKNLQNKLHAGIFNQALIEFGALQCTPHTPQCFSCPFIIECKARQLGNIELFPVKKGKIKVQPLFLYYFVIKKNNRWIIEQRTETGIWRNLYQFPALESFDSLSIAQAIENYFGPSSEIIQLDCSLPISHQLSHRSIKAYFITLDVSLNIFQSFAQNASFEEMNTLPFPKLITNYLERLPHNLPQ